MAVVVCAVIKTLITHLIDSKHHISETNKLMAQMADIDRQSIVTLVVYCGELWLNALQRCHSDPSGDSAVEAEDSVRTSED